jgi:hypothetical protein
LAVRKAPSPLPLCRRTPQGWLMVYGLWLMAGRKSFEVVFIFFQIMQTMQSDVAGWGAFVRGWAHGKEKRNWFLVDC